MLPQLRALARRRLQPLLIGFVCLAAAHFAHAETPFPLSARIDELIGVGKPAYETKAAPLASDAEFLRRVTLDLVGTIPNSAKARAFLDEPATDKRAALIDQLLASPESARHLQRVFDVQLMERRGDKHVPSPQWQEFLRTSFVENRPWNEVVAEMLAGDGSDPARRPAAKFVLDRDAEPHTVTRDVGRLFLGRDMQCAQCHDHPLVDGFHQQHYYGIFAYLNRSYLAVDAANVAFIGEKAEGDVSFTSVFDKTKAVHQTNPRLIELPAPAEPAVPKGDEYIVTPVNNARAIPRYSRRERLARELTANRLFARNTVNRLWAMMMGRGLVDPVDMDHPDNPPSHPQLLDLLTDEFIASNYNVKTMLREIARTKTYQRASELPAGSADVPPQMFAVAPLKALTPEQLGWAIMQGTGLTDAVVLGMENQVKASNPKFAPFLLADAAWRERTLHAQLAPNTNVFVGIYAGPPGAPEAKFAASVEQALFVVNGNVVRDWLAPRGGSLLDRLIKLTDAELAAEELYLTVLTRRPSYEERLEVVEYLKPRTMDRNAALAELAWALLASSEFRFNH